MSTGWVRGGYGAPSELRRKRESMNEFVASLSPRANFPLDPAGSGSQLQLHGRRLGAHTTFSALIHLRDVIYFR